MIKEYAAVIREVCPDESGCSYCLLCAAEFSAAMCPFCNSSSFSVNTSFSSSIVGRKVLEYLDELEKNN